MQMITFNKTKLSKTEVKNNRFCEIKKKVLRSLPSDTMREYFAFSQQRLYFQI